MKKLEPLGIIHALPIAFQHVLAMVVGCVTVPVILGSAGQLSQADIIIMMQASLFCASIAILIHAFGDRVIQTRLPVIIGSGFAFIPTLTVIVKDGGMSAVLGAQLIGALFGILVGLCFKKIRFLFPPVVTAAVVITIGISLYPTAVRYMGGNVGSLEYGSLKNWIVALVTLSAVIFFSNFTKGIYKVSAMLLGLIIGYLLALSLGMVDFSQVMTSSWLALPKPFHFGMSFSTSAIVSMIIIFVINSIQDIGQFEATSNGIHSRSASDEEISYGVIANNISSGLGSVLGGTPNATCGQNVGIVVTTQVETRIVFVLAALFIMLAGLIPKVAALFITIPYPVLGGATISVFGSIAMTGIRMLSNAGLTQRNVTIAGLAIALAVGCAQSKGIFALCPSWIQILLGGSEIVIVALAAIVLNLVLPKDQ